MRTNENRLLRRFSLFGLREGLDAVGAHLYALSANFRPLEIGLLACFAGRIVVAAQKHAAGDHAGTFMTIGAFDGHMRVEPKYCLDIIYEN